MNKTLKSLASLFVVMAMVISMIPTSFIITASALTVPAEGLTFSLKKSDSGSGPDIYTNWSSLYSGKFIDSSTQNYQAGYQNNDYAQVKEYVQFDSSKTYTFTLDVALYDENATRDMPELQIGGSTVTQFTQAQITQAMRDNHSSLPSGYAWESSYFTYQATYTYTPSDNNSKQIKLVFKHDDKDKVGFKSLTISEGGSGGGGGGDDPSGEVLIATLTSSEDWSWTQHQLSPAVDFTGYENVRFEARALKGEFNKIGLSSSDLHYFGNKTSLDGKLDGTDSNVQYQGRNVDVTNTANVTFYWEGNGQFQIKFYGTPIGGGGDGTTYEVNFSGTNGTVTATVGGNAISSGDSVSEGASVTFTATPSAGYAFTSWSDGSTDNPHAVTINADTTLTATFTEVPTYTVNFSGTNGTVTATVGGNAISSGDSVAEGTEVTFTATPSAGYAFSQWNDGNNTNPRTVTVNANTTMTATFTEQTSGEVLITTLTSTESGGGRHTLGTVDFTNYTDVRFEMTSTNTQYGFNRLYINNKDHYFGDTSSRSGKLDGTESYTDVTGLSDVLFEFQGWPTTTITFYGVRVGGDTPSGTTDTLRVEAEDYTSSSNNNRQTKGSDTYYGAYSGDTWMELTGECELYVPIEIPDTSATYTIKVRYTNNGGGKNTWVNLWDPNSSGENITVGGNTYYKRSYAQLGSTGQAFTTATPFSNVSFSSTGTYYVGLYGGQYAAYDYVEVVASENVYGEETTTYTVTIGSAENGSASADTNEVEDGEDVTVTATPASHYHLSDWLVDGVSIGDDTNPLVYTPEANVEITPVFAIDTFTVSLTAGDHGSVSGAGTYDYNEEVTITATPAEHYHFVEWSDGNTNASRTFNITENVTLTATFAIDTFTVSLTAGDHGSVSGAGTYNYNAEVTITATPDSGYHFVKWSDNDTNASRTFNITENVTLTATFAIDTFTISLTAGDHGSVSGAGTYDYNEEVTITATPDSGYHFVKWSDNDTNASRTFNITENVTLTATFEEDAPIQYTITGASNGNGTVSGTATVNAGTSVTLTATPDSGYRFVKWDDENTDNPRTVIANADATYTAIFEQVVTYTISTAVSPTGSGTVTGAGTYNENASVTLTATPATGYTFARWEKGGETVSTNASYTFTATETATYTAVFTINSYTITVEVNDNDYGSVTGGGTYNYGATANLTATPNSGYTFDGWYLNSSKVSSSASYSPTVTGTATYTAVFVVRSAYTDTKRIEAEYTTLENDVTAQAPTENVTVAETSNGMVAKFGESGTNNIAHFSFTAPETGTYAITFRAVGLNVYDRTMQFFINNDFHEETVPYTGWTDFTYNVDMTAGTTYDIGAKANGSWNSSWQWLYVDYFEIVAPSAVFPNGYTVTATASGDANATVAVSPDEEVYASGDNVTVTVTPSSATYKVAYWTVNGENVYSTDTSYTITDIDKDYTVSVTLVQSYDTSAVIKAADENHPYAYAEAIFPRADFPNLYDNSNWENGFDIVFSYDLKDASGNPITFYGTATGSFIVEGASGNVYKQSDEGVANNEAAAISNCWYMGSDTVSAVKLLLTELRYTNYNNGEYGDLDIGKTVNFHVLSLTHRDTPYVDLSNKTSNYIIYGNEIPVTNLGIDGYSNGNGSSTINFQTVVDATNEFDNHRVWQIIYHLDTSEVDDETGGINSVYVGRYYIVPDGDVAVDATGGSGFSFYYRTAENQTKGTWITMQSNLFTTHGQNLLNLEPMKVYLEPTYGEWKAYYATYDLSAAAGQTITYWDFFIDGGDPCVEVPGGYLFDQDSDYWIKSATDATFWFSELRLERYKTVTITYKDQWDKVIETREVRLGSIQAPSTLTAREGYLFSYWTLNGDIVGPYWYFGEEGLEDYSGAIAVPNADGAYCYDNGHFNQPVTEARTYVAHYVYNGNYYNVTATNGTITITNTQSGLTTDPVTEGSYDYETLIKLEANKDTAADFMYWSYGEYKVDSNGDPVLDGSGNKQYRHFAILSYKPTVSTNVMGHADYFAIYADDIASSAVGVVNPILAYYTPDKTGNGSGKVYRSTNTSKGTDEIYAYASMFTRAIAFDTYHDSQYNKLSFISTIAYKEDLYNPIGFGVVVTGYKASAQSILNFSSGSTFSEEVLLAKTGEATTSDEMAITYENFLSATTHFYTANGARSVQEIPFKEESLKTALTSGQFLTSITGLDNQSRRYARTFLIVEDKTSGAVYVVYSDTYANAAIGSVPTQYDITANIKIGETASSAEAVDTTTEGHTTTATASGNYITGVGSITSGMSGFLRAVAEIGYEFYGWDTDGDGAIDVTTPLVSYTEISSALTYTAYFKSVQTVYVTATVATTNGGTIASSIQNGQVNSGTTVYLYAMPNDGYTFVGWVKSSSELGISYVPESYTSTDAAYSFTATNERTYVYAYFRSDTDGKATVRPIIGSVAGGTATVNGRSYVTVVPDTTVTLTATPKLGYSFVSWTIDDVVVSTNATFNYTVESTDNVIVTANFEAVEGLTDTKTLEAENYTVAKYNYLTGDVLSSSDALDTDSDGDVVYTILSYSNSDEENTHVNKNKIVQLIPFTAPVAGTYDFKVYYKKTNENSDIYIDVYNTDSTTSYSEVTIDGTTYYETWYYGSESGDTNNNTTWGANSYDVKLTLAANEKILIGLCDNKGLGAEFDRVVVTCENGNVFSTSGDVAQATITFATVGGGTIYNTIDPDDTTTVLSGTSVDYNVGARVGMHAVPDAGKVFVGWSLDGGTTTFTNENVTKDTLYTHRVSSNATITAKFETYTNLNHNHIASGESYYTATITVENGNSATVKSYWSSNSEAYYIDTVTSTQTMQVPTRKITLTAVDDPEAVGTNEFAGWYQDGVFKTSERTFKTDYISANTTIVAKYLTAADASDITLTAVGNGSILDDTGAVVTSGEFLNSSVQKFTAAPAVGYIFTGWSTDGATPSLTNGTLGNGTIVGEGEYDLTVTEDETIYAHFAAYNGTHTHDVGGETYYDVDVTVQNGNTVIVKNYWSASSEAYYLDSTTSSMTITVPNRKLTLSAVDKVVSEGEINTFAGWYQDGVLIGMGEGANHEIQTAKKIKADTTIEARYVSALSLTASVNYYGAGTITQSSTTASEITITPTDGTSYTFTASEPANYYSFDGWYNGDTKLASTNEFTYTYDDADGSVELVAKYDYVSVDTMPIISILTADYESTNAEPTSAGFNAIAKSDYKNATVNVLNGDDYNNYTLVDASAKVKGRGNSTWNTSTTYGLKRAIRFKFNSKQNLLNINKNGTSKNWVLLANNLDRSLLRNSLAFELGDKLTNILYSSKYASVEVYINGVYQGVYLLCEQSEADATRALITEPVDDSTTEVDAFIELDNVQNFTDSTLYSSDTIGNTYDGDYYFQISTTNWTTYQDPAFVIKSDIFSSAQYSYLSTLFGNAQTAIYGGTEATVETYIDVDSFVDMYILQEIAKNTDVGYSSFYFAVKNGKIYCTTPWDFDKAFGNDKRGDATTGLYVGEGTTSDNTQSSLNTNPWFIALMDTDWFLAAVKARWTELYEDDVFSDVIDTITADYTKYAASYGRNWTKWSSKIADGSTHLDNEADEYTSFASSAAAKNQLVTWYNARITYLNGLFNTSTPVGTVTTTINAIQSNDIAAFKKSNSATGYVDGDIVNGGGGNYIAYGCGFQLTGLQSSDEITIKVYVQGQGSPYAIIWDGDWAEKMYSTKSENQSQALENSNWSAIDTPTVFTYTGADFISGSTYYAGGQGNEYLNLKKIEIVAPSTVTVTALSALDA